MSCVYCGEQHGQICPWVKAKEFYPMDDNFKGGGVKRVEFWSRAELDKMMIEANQIVPWTDPPLRRGGTAKP